MTTTDHRTFPPAGAGEIDEVGALVVSLFGAPPTRLTACRGWTAHELVAHLAAGAAEEADLIAAHCAGVERATRAFEVREAPYRALPDAQLRDRLVEEVARLTTALDQLASREGDHVMFSGRAMSAADFAMHSRSECTLHRWDLVGRDDIGWAALAQPALTSHALGVLSAMSSLPETPANRVRGRAGAHEVQAILRSAPHDDVVVTLTGSELTLASRPIDETAPDVELDPAARLLLIWGRREPSAPVDVLATGPTAELLEALFGW